jgi:hypothetical protein
VEYRIRRLKTQDQRKGLTASRSFGRLLTRPEPIKESLLQFVGRAGENVVSADGVHGFERFNVQNISRGRGIRPRRSADDLGGLEEDNRRNREPQRLGGLQIDDELERGGLLNGEVSWLGPLQDLVHVHGNALPTLRRT